MHRIDTAGSVDGLFVDGTPQLGQQGTILGADWANDIQGNIAKVIEDAGEELVKGDYDQLRLAIQMMIDDAAETIIEATLRPVGEVLSIDGPDAPAGTLPLDGVEDYLKTDFPQLVAYYTAQGRLIAGSDADHFKTPNYMGRVPRGWSIDATVDPDGPRAPGSLQEDAFKSHNHSVSPTASTDDTASGATTTGSGGAETITPYNTGSTGGSETRGKNFATLWCVVAR